MALLQRAGVETASQDKVSPSTDLMRPLLKASSSCVLKAGRTALMIAASEGHYVIVQHLLETAPHCIDDRDHVKPHRLAA